MILTSTLDIPGVITIMCCGGHFCKRSIFVTDIQNEWRIIIPETQRASPELASNRSVTLECTHVTKWTHEGSLGYIWTLRVTTSTNRTPNVP